MAESNGQSGLHETVTAAQVDPPGSSQIRPDFLKGQRVATFAAGCFWGVEYRFRQIEGVIDAEVGYIGGATVEPTYRQVCNGDTGHAEAGRVVFDPSLVSYSDLVRDFFAMHNPTQRNRQGPDIGTQYRSAIFVHDGKQRETAEAAKAALDKEFAETGKTGGRPVATEINEPAAFWRAEEYHQRYMEKNPNAACHI